VLIRIRNFFISIFYHCGIESTVRILRISAAFTEAFPLFVDYEATTRRADDADVDLHLHSEPYFRCVDVQNNRARQTASAWRTLCRHRRLRARRFTQKNYLHKIRWKGVTWANEETGQILWYNPNHVTVGLGLR